jgi:hypothetical protein
MAAAAGIIGIGASLAGGILGAQGAEKSGQSQQQMYNYQSQVAKINSQIDQQNREYALNYGEIKAMQSGMRYRQEEGHILATQGASNIDMTSGSSVDVRNSERTLASLDAGQIRANAAKVAYDYDVKSTMDLNQSTLDVMAGQNAKTAGDIQAMSSILGSIGSVSSKWMQGTQSGMFSSRSLLT